MLTTKQLAQNIVAVYNQATTGQIEGGQQWYTSANNYASQIAELTNTPLPIVALVIAALSTRNRWVFSLTTGNLGDALRVIQAAQNGLTADAVKVSTFNRNKDKAFAIITYYLDTNDTDLDYYHTKYFGTAIKTWNFANNIINPNNDRHVTIDGHAYHIAIGIKATLDDAKGLTKKQYAHFVWAYRVAARYLGLSVVALQAITWEAYRNPTTQMTLPL